MAYWHDVKEDAENSEAPELCPECGMDWSNIPVLPAECPEFGADTSPF